MEIKKSASKVKNVIISDSGRKNINLAIVSANNHYAGFGPETANMFRKMVGLPETKWQEDDDKNEKDKEYEEEKKDKTPNSPKKNIHQQHHLKQSTLSDFMM
jgi:hypothetical protein